MGKPSAPKFARNKNILVIGGSGSGKTRFFVKPNLMQMHSSYVVTDPKGTVLVECGRMLQRGRPKRVDGNVVYRRDDKGNYLKDKKGRYIPVYEPYKIKVFNTIDFAKSMHYNPFAYISKKNREKDILKFVEVLIKNTSSSQQPSGDDFWVKAEKLLYTAYIALIFAMYPEDQWNFETLIDMINNSECREDDEEFKNCIDLEFEIVECWLNGTKHEDPEVMADYGDIFETKPDAEQRRLGAFALKQFKAYKLAAGVVCSKRLLNQAVGKSLRTHNLKPKKGAQAMRKNEKITALYERLSRDDFGKDDDQQRESNSISNQKAMLEEFAARQGFTNIVHFTDDGISGTCFDRPGFLAIVDVSAGQDLCLVIKICQNNTLSIFNGKERIVFAVDKTNHTIIPVRIRKSKNAHDIYRLVVGHRASPLSFFGVVRFFSYSASFAFAHSGSLFVSATPRTSVMSHRHRSPEYNSSK